MSKNGEITELFTKLFTELYTKLFFKECNNGHIIIMSNNVSGVPYINNMGECNGIVSIL